MTVFWAILLTTLAFAFIGYPLWKPRLRPVDLFRDENAEELHSKRDTTYSMLKELEFDFQSGILTEEDYQELAARYKGKAISILKDIDSVAKVSAGEDEIEKEVRELRRGKRSSSGTTGSTSGADVGEDEIEKEVRELRRGKRSSPGTIGSTSDIDVEDEVEKQVQERRHKEGQFCTQCGTKRKAGDRFCAHCGARL